MEAERSAGWLTRATAGGGWAEAGQLDRGEARPAAHVYCRQSRANLQLPAVTLDLGPRGDQMFLS